MSNKSFGSDLFYYAITYIVPMIVGFMLVPIFTERFTTEEFGQYSLINSTVGLLGIISVNWINVAFIRFYSTSEKEQREDQLISISFLMALLTASVLSILIYVGAVLGITEKIIPEKYALISIVLLFSANIHSFMFSYLRAKRKARFATILTSVTVFSRFLLFLYLLDVIQSPINALILSTIISDIIYIAVVILKDRKGLRLIKRSDIDFEYIKPYVKYGLPFILILGVHWLLTLSDRYMIEFLRNSDEVGIYSINYSFAQQIMMPLITIFMTTAEPILFRLSENNTETELNGVLNKIFKYFLLVLIPCAVGLAAVSDNLASLFIKNDFQQGYIIMPIVTFGFLFLGIRQYFNKSLEIIKRSKEIANISVIAALVNIGLNFVLIPMYGYIGAAYATLIAYVVYFLLSYYKTVNLTTIKISFSKAHVQTIIAALSMGACVYGVGRFPFGNVILEIIVQIIIGMIVYALILLAFGTVKNEKKFILEKLGKVRKKVAK
ncbi:flippase [Alkalihalobacillus sp. CinArs1]|uniref:flippase n=1 Tax=Alkalihalobacillus sp. CinArs1 TaxID=2995314 RepID=UPI0022DE14F3|nr:flippase [Alkalihalobacillus sp. CinArs1]